MTQSAALTGKLMEILASETVREVSGRIVLYNTEGTFFKSSSKSRFVNFSSTAA